MNFNIALRVLPFAILLLITTVAWYDILTVPHVARIRHLIGSRLIIINIFAYIFNLRLGVLLTGITLFLATINLAAFTSTIVTKQFFQPLALLLLGIFLLFNLKYLLK